MIHTNPRCIHFPCTCIIPPKEAYPQDKQKVHAEKILFGLAYLAILIGVCLHTSSFLSPDSNAQIDKNHAGSRQHTFRQVLQPAHQSK